MRRGSVYVLVALAALLLEGGFRGSAPPLGPGDKIGAMTLARGVEHRAQAEFFAFCNPAIPKPGRYRRTCSFARVQQLFIGYGDFELTRKRLDVVWKHLKWHLWVDGRQVSLARFGTSERTLYAYPPAGGKNAILREWDVILVGVTPGKHTLRYRSSSRSLGTTDATWTFTVEG